MQVATPYADALLAEHGIVGVVGMLKKTLQPSDWKLFFNLTIVIGRLTVLPAFVPWYLQTRRRLPAFVPWYLAERS